MTALSLLPLLSLAQSSCRGHCGSWADTCWCNDACVSHGDCCSDYAAVCGTGAAALHLLTAYPDAKCLDGSPAGYYLRAGSNTSKYLIFFEGGGWCYDDACEMPTAVRRRTFEPSSRKARTSCRSHAHS